MLLFALPTLVEQRLPLVAGCVDSRFLSGWVNQRLCKTMNVGAIATPALGVVEGDDLKRGTIPWVRISLPMRRELPVKPRILIVEDEVMIRIFMRDVFEEAGFKTREAANADEALELLKAEEFAAILSDIEMPGTMTGVDLAWVANSKWPRTGLILVSGRRLPSLMRMPTKARFIAKPCQVDLLLQTVSEVLLP